jgi:hypothetical protein
MQDNLLSVNSPLTVDPRAKTATTMTAAMAASTKPYSTAEAPVSSVLLTVTCFKLGRVVRTEDADYLQASGRVLPATAELQMSV